MMCMKTVEILYIPLYRARKKVEGKCKLLKLHSLNNCFKSNNKYFNRNIHRLKNDQFVKEINYHIPATRSLIPTQLIL